MAQPAKVKTETQHIAKIKQAPTEAEAKCCLVELRALCNEGEASQELQAAARLILQTSLSPGVIEDAGARATLASRASALGLRFP